MCNVDGYPFSRQFLEQYFARYDNQESRDSISEAYAENANFSMTAFGSGPGWVVDLCLKNCLTSKLEVVLVFYVLLFKPSAGAVYYDEL